MRTVSSDQPKHRYNTRKKQGKPFDEFQGSPYRLPIHNFLGRLRQELHTDKYTQEGRLKKIFDYCSIRSSYFDCPCLLGLLNISSILLVTRKPPIILIEEMNAAPAARDWAELDGNKPPPICSKPPTAVMPEMAFVTDISGE